MSRHAANHNLGELLMFDGHFVVAEIHRVSSTMYYDTVVHKYLKLIVLQWQRGTDPLYDAFSAYVQPAVAVELYCTYI